MFTKPFLIHHAIASFEPCPGITALVSSSFADEAFAKLFIDVGPVEFMKKFEFKNTMSTVQKLIDKSITQRMSTGI